ncbi:12061_t:CDS:2 [Entrophospora sp. SA101]|nr:12061_t:CDS:2 [Entrophospora sp. SA101]
MDHIRALKNKKNTDTDGEPSLQNALELARSSLIHVPSHGSREILIIMGSLTTCDPGDINITIENLIKENIHVSIVGLAAEVQICKLMCKKTKGTYGIVLHEAHFRDLLFEIIPPPPVSNAQNKSELVMMGFPSSVNGSKPSFCACHQKLTTKGYTCSRCDSKVCDLPTDCPICELTLVSSPHLARSYHHLFPVENYVEVPWSGDIAPNCFSCQVKFTAQPSIIPISQLEASSGRYKCPNISQSGNPLIQKSSNQENRYRNRNAGTLERWYSGTLERSYSGTLVLWNSRTLELSYSGTLVLSTLGLRNSGTRTLVPLVHWNIETLILRNSGALDTGTLEHWYPGTLVPWNTGTLGLWYPGTLELSYSGTLVHWNTVLTAGSTKILEVVCLQ